MHIEIRGHLKATDAIRDHIDRRLNTAVGRFRHRVRTVTIWLEDINGPAHGGHDKACQIAVVLHSRRRNPVVVEEVHADLYSAVTKAAERTSLAVRRELDRLHHPRMRSPASAS